MKEHELVKEVKGLVTRVNELRDLLSIEQKKTEIQSLKTLSATSDFWYYRDRAQAVLRRLANLQKEIATWEKLSADAAALAEIVTLDEDDQTVSLRLEAEREYAGLRARLEELEFKVLLAGPHDAANAVVAIHAGAGGVDAQDWAMMLLRMLTRFCDRQKWRVNILDESRGEQHGIKSVFLEIEGEYAYGYLQSEHGVHRLVRISPFDAEKMRHTSFAMIEVIPELADATEDTIWISPGDLRIDVYRSGGKGGQSVNTTDSAVRIVHLPTGITVTCQNERSQLQNKTKAMQVLRSKLRQYEQAKREEERQILRGEFTEAAWGNQIRSYVLHPYKMVKDHRSDYETSDPEAVLDGELMPFMEAYLRYRQGQAA
ncbi:MAG: peptide chain release factor 2 [Patescibacteria group bacterium]